MQDAKALLNPMLGKSTLALVSFAGEEDFCKALIVYYNRIRRRSGDAEHERARTESGLYRKLLLQRRQPPVL